MKIYEKQNMKICLIQVSVTELHQRRALLLTSLLLTGLIRKRLHQKNRENRNPRHGCRVSNNSLGYFENLTTQKSLPVEPGTAVSTCLNMSEHVSTVLSPPLGYTARRQVTLGSFSRADSVSKVPCTKLYMICTIPLNERTSSE